MNIGRLALRAAVGGFFFAVEWGYVIAFIFFIAVMFLRPRGILGK